ncbi:MULTISPECIES: alanine racemase [unclassified Streptomyces]|uniref:alanine racemase n=1 Tax=unclassified Streptomyces TaxID=2593676 RepID=UPI002E281855|nr:alanine racemase [Streptomyces sp. NBC_00334]
MSEAVVDLSAIAHGATWLGVTSSPETLKLREAGITAPILAWMRLPGEDVTEALRRDVDLSASSPGHLAGIAACAEKAGVPGIVHLKVDTGLERNGADPADWPQLLESAVDFERQGLLRVRGVWSHLVHPDDPRHASVPRQRDAFDTAVAQARAAGLHPEVLHLANSAAALAAPGTHYDLVRAGIGLYGVESVRGESFGLRPAMTLRGRVIMSRRVDAGTGVSYGHDYVAERPTALALVPLGFADGLPFRASASAEILVGGVRRRVAGRIAMDQCVVDTGNEQVAIGEDAVVLGPGDHGEPTAVEWAEWAGTVPHEILTGVGPRVPRRYLHAEAPPAAPRDTRIRVVVLFGGPGGEHEVSCASAAGIVGELDRSRYAVQPVRITRAREWVPGPADFAQGAYTAEDLTEVTPSRGMSAGDSLRSVLPHLATADAVIPSLHGPFGEDGTVQGLLEAANVTYVGNGVSASTIAMDKDATKRILHSVGLPVADWALLRGRGGALSEAERLRLGLPAFVKPARAGSARTTSGSQ